jgi:hypothetical protein
LRYIRSVRWSERSKARAEADRNRWTPVGRLYFERNAAAWAGGTSNSGAVADKEADEIPSLAPGVEQPEVRTPPGRIAQVRPDWCGSTVLWAVQV